MKANETLFMLYRLTYERYIFLCGWFAYLKKHAQSSACIIAISVDEKRGTEKQTG